MITFGYRCQGTEEDGTLATYRALYRGDRVVTISMLRQKFMAADLSDIARLAESSRNMAVVNELRTIIDRRIDAMPNTFDPAHEVEAAQTAAVEWASGPVAPRGRSLYGCLAQIVRDQELDGNAALVLYGAGDGIRVAVRDTEHMTMGVDPLTGEPSEVRFEWSDKSPGGPRVDYSEVFTPTTRTIAVNGDVTQEAHAFGAIPVVVIPREITHGSPVGVSGVAELVEAYAYFLWTVYLLNVLNKFESHGLYCPDQDTGAFLPDQSGNAPTTFRVSPGCLVPVPIRKVGGNITAGPLLQQLDQSLESLYRIGRVKRDRGASGDMRSGKALMIDTHELLDYIDRKCQLLREGLAKLFDLWAVASGHPTGYTIELPQLMDDDPAEQSRRAELWLKAYAADLSDERGVLERWQALGLIDQEADIDEMAQAVADRKAEAQTAQMERMAATIEGMRQTQPEADSTEEEVMDDGEDAG